MPAARAASSREDPSSTSARASIRRAARASRHRAASRRSSPAPGSCRVIAIVIRALPCRRPTTDQPRRAPRGSGRDNTSGIQAVGIIGTLLRSRLQLAQFPALLPNPRGGPASSAVLFATLPLAEAFRRAAEAHPGLRAPPPEGGVLRECLRRHGVVGTWTDLPALVPDLAPDATAATAVEHTERSSLEVLK